MMTTLLLSAHALTKSYLQGQRRLSVLDALDLNIEAGERVALLGRSGSGKSTLLNLLGGIDAPDSGTICIKGTQLQDLDERQRTLFRRQHVGYIYQAFNLIPTLTAQENVALPLELNGYSLPDAASGAADILGQVGLSEHLSVFPDQLSGGEQQRVAIARALVHQPTLVLADEPTGNLDAETGQQVLSLLENLLADRRHGLFIVTHSAAVAKRADRVLTLVAGRLRVTADQLAW